MNKNRFIIKKILSGILIASFTFSALSKGEEVNGFKQIKWQAPISKYEGVMQLTSEQGNAKKFYIIENDDMSYGNISLSSIVYVFYNDKFSSVTIQTDKDSKNSARVLVELKKKFGEPSYSNKYINKYRWEDENTMVSLKCYSSSHKCSVKFNSMKMSQLEKNKQ